MCVGGKNSRNPEVSCRGKSTRAASLYLLYELVLLPGFRRRCFAATHLRASCSQVGSLPFLFYLATCCAPPRRSMVMARPPGEVFFGTYGLGPAVVEACFCLVPDGGMRVTVPGQATRSADGDGWILLDRGRQRLASRATDGLASVVPGGKSGKFLAALPPWGLRLTALPFLPHQGKGATASLCASVQPPRFLSPTNSPAHPP